jgi:hypothetical protein
VGAIEKTDEYSLVKGEFGYLSPNNPDNPYSPDHPYPYEPKVSSYSMARMNSAMLPSGDTTGGKQLVDGLGATSRIASFAGGQLYVKPSDDPNDYKLKVRQGDSVSDFQVPGTNGSVFGLSSATKSSKSVVAWESMNAKFPKTDKDDDLAAIMAQTSNSFEMNLGYWDGSKWSVAKQLTDDQLADMKPKTAISSDGEAIAVWSKGTMDSDTNPGQASLAYARYSGSGDKDEDFHISTIPLTKTPSEYSVAMDDKGNALVAVSYAATGADMGEIEYFLIEKGATSTDPDLVTRNSDENKGVGPQVIWDGRFKVSFYSEFKIQVSDKVEEKSRETIRTTEEPSSALYFGSADASGTVTTFQLPGSQSIGRSFRMTASENGPVITWTGLTTQPDGVGSTLYSAKLASYQDAAGSTAGVLSDPVELGSTKYSVAALDLQPEGSGVRALALIADSDPTSATSGSAGLYEFSSGNFGQKIAVKADFSYDDVRSGAEVPVTFTVKNNGYLPITSLTLDGIGNKVTQDPVNGTDDEGKPLNLEPGASTTITGIVKVPEDGVLTNHGQYRGKVTAVFDDADKTEATGEDDIDLNTTDLSLSLLNTPNGSGVVLKKISSVQLPKGAKLSLGVYTDAAGNSLVAGQKEIILSAEQIGQLNSGLGVNQQFSGLPSDPNLIVYAVAKVIDDAQSDYVYEGPTQDNVVALSLNPKVPGASAASLSPSSAEFSNDVTSDAHKDVTTVLSAAGDIDLKDVRLVNEKSKSMAMLDSVDFEQTTVLLAGSQYTTEASDHGVTAITFKKEFLDQLDSGSRRFIVGTIGGTELDFTLTITGTHNKPDPKPDRQDDSNGNGNGSSGGVIDAGGTGSHPGALPRTGAEISSSTGPLAAIVLLLTLVAAGVARKLRRKELN